MTSSRFPTWGVVAVTLVAAVLHVLLASATGDLNGHYTDHLRHLTEAQALVARGDAIYRQPYDEFSRGLLPCPEHAGLFSERTAPYPPLGVLLHWPLSVVERAGWLAPPRVHELTALTWLLCGCLAAGLALWLAWPRRVESAGVLLLLAPLALGAGANGFYDTAFLAAGLGALVGLVRGRAAWAVVLLGLAAALHFRALVFAPVGLWALLEAWKQGPRRAVLAAVPAALLVLSAAWAAWALQGTLDTIPAHNPVHVSHLLGLRPAPLLFVGLGLAVSGWLARSGAPWAGLSVVAAMLVALADRSHGYWHALVLVVPPMVLAAERREDRRGLALVAWGWCVGAALLAFRFTTTAFWQWLVDALRQRVT